MSSRLPTVSIVTPSYNHGQFIEETLASVRRQDYPNLEHIVVDGGSTDSTLDILRRYEGTYRMKWISEKDSGQADAINKGFRLAAGDIVAWLNSDDVYIRKDTVGQIVHRFDARPGVHVIYGNDVLIDESGRFYYLRRSTSFSPEIMFRGNIVSQPATFFRRAVVEHHRLDDTLHYVMDYEYWLRLYFSGFRFLHINRVLAGNRIHPQRKMIAGRVPATLEFETVRRRMGFRGDAIDELLAYSDRVGALFRRVLALWEVFGIWREKDETQLRSDSTGLLDLLTNQICLPRLKRAEAQWAESAS